MLRILGSFYVGSGDRCWNREYSPFLICRVRSLPLPLFRIDGRQLSESPASPVPLDKLEEADIAEPVGPE
jgi:hypothetical protein